MIKFSDTQRVLLSAAAQRDDASLLPLPASLEPGGGTSKAIDALVSRGFAAERESADPSAIRRAEGDVSYGVFATPAGLEAIGAAPEPLPVDDDTTAVPRTIAAGPPRASKTAAVLALLEREEGATVAELIDATGWLPHTMRAALTGLRKKGHVIERSKRGEVTCYRIPAVEGAQ
jgi:hypothetical protein